MAHPSEILRALDAAPLKRFSQNFLTSPHWAQKLADALFAPPFDADSVWEIGPGLGAITSVLKEKSGTLPLRLFEIDRKLAAYLAGIFPDIEIMEGDFLEADIDALLRSDRRVALLSNLPYHLSSPIFFKILERRQQFPRLVFTFQKEFGERLMARPRTGAYGGLSVLAQLAYRMQPLGVVPAGAFYPEPDVASLAVAFQPIPEGEVAWEKLNQVVKAAFSHRRKKLSSNLSEIAPKGRISEALGTLQFSETVRAEELSPAQYLDLTKFLV